MSRSVHRPKLVRRGARRGQRTGLFPEIQLPTAAPDAAPLHVRIYRQLREHILSGALGPGARIPSARALAHDLRVSRNTIEASVQQLVAEGFVERRVGSGTVIAQSLAEAAPFPERDLGKGVVEIRSEVPVTRRARLLVAIGGPETEADALVGSSASDAGFFPWQRWTAMTARFARRAGLSSFGPASPRGFGPLRREIAEYVALSRGLKAAANNVVIVSSTQQAIDLCARALLDPGDDAFVEDPGYPSARGAFLAAGARVHLAGVDECGLRVEALPEASGRAKRRPRLLYITPSQQFPLGGTLPLARRLAALRWAERNAAWIIEDDCDREFWYDDRPLAALHGLDRSQRVIYVGTFNKALFPGLRLAYLVVPEDRAATFAAARRLSDGFSPVLPQLVLADFMSSGQFAANLRRARNHYRACRDALLATIHNAWGANVRVGPASAGLHVAARFSPRVDDREIAARLRGLAGGLGVAALSRYSATPAPSRGGRFRGLLLNFGATSAASVRESAERMAPVVRAATRA